MDLGNQIENSVAAAEPSLGPPPFKKGKTQQFNSGGVVKWAYFQKKWSIPLSKVFIHHWKHSYVYDVAFLLLNITECTFKSH